MYKGHFINVKCSKKSTTPKVTVTYWKYEETEEEGEDVTMTLIEFLVDYINCDLQINEPATFSSLEMCTEYDSNVWLNNFLFCNNCRHKKANRHNVFFTPAS